MRVLVAEDERNFLDAIVQDLREQGMAVDVAETGDSALRKATVFDYDVIVLDRALRTVEGNEVSPALIHSQPGTRILMLSTVAPLEDVVASLNRGADDYLAKPFEPAELVARVRALGRRAGPARPPRLRFGDLVLDPARREVTRRDAPVELTRKELAVLEELLGAEGATVSTEELLTRVWDENVDPFTNSVRVTMMTLRRKLGPPPLIETVNGVGYRIG
jgi:DNA-binding response OmpR family regulator